jgi:hypothetical protein
MSWWDEEGYRVGDTPADYLTDMLKSIQADNSDKANRIPFGLFLGALMVSINSKRALFSDSDRLPVSAITARLTGKMEIESVTPDHLSKAMIDSVDQALISICDVFKSAFDELPTTGDFKANLEFVLSKPGEYFELAPLPNESSLWSLNLK